MIANCLFQRSTFKRSNVRALVSTQLKLNLRMKFLDSLIPSDWICAVNEKGCALVNLVTKEKRAIDFKNHSFERFQQENTMKHFVWNNENEKMYIIGEKSVYYDDQIINYINIFECKSGLLVYFFKADEVTFQEDGKSLLHTKSNGDVTRWWFNYTHKDINVESCKRGDQHHFHLQNAKTLRAFLDSGKRISAVVPLNEYLEKIPFVTRMELAVKNADVASVKVLLLEGLNPLSDGIFKNNKRFPEYAKISTDNSYEIALKNYRFGNQDMLKVLKEMEEWIHDKKAYEHKHSALIPFVMGTVSLDWPVLVSTIVAEYLVWVNDNYIAQFSEVKSWNIAAFVKKRYRKINI